MLNTTTTLYEESTVPRPTDRPLTRCRELREGRGMLKIELAVRSETSLGVVDRMESAVEYDDIQCMYVGSFIAIATALGVAPSTLYPPLGKLATKTEPPQHLSRYAS